jgi:molecular chaperone DnaK (HSP70)
MILDSFDNAETDFHERQLIEARNEASTILSAVAKAPSHPAWQQLTQAERSKITQLAAEVEILRNGGDLDSLRRGTETLDQATRHFAEMMMDATVSSALHGKTMDAADAKIGEGPSAPHPIAPADFR